MSDAISGGVTAVADARERVRDALREPAALGRRPALHGSRRDGEGRAFTDAQQQTDHDTAT